MRARYVKSLDAADGAEQMLCSEGIELVRRKNLGAGQQLEPRLCDDEMEVPRLCAYSAIAISNF